MSTKYKRPKGATYRLKSDTLKFEFGLTGPYGFIKHREISFREHASLVYSTRQPRQLDDQREIYGLLEDLFILLTGSELILNWPKVSLQGNSAEYNWYFWRDGSPTSTPINFREFWTNFPQLKKDFGSIWTKWRSLRDYTGPGVYLYLGTRRGMRMYTEHRFVNLIWGIEAFHRKRDQAEPSDAFLKKLERIVSQVKDPKDATWLRGKLRHAHDPSLANRITSVIKSLPIGLDPSLVVRFADECATKRNDISHFGGAKDGVSYNEFIKRLDQLSDALTTLYHYLLLHEIGVSADVLNRQIYDGLRSHAIKRNFVDVGLLKQVPKKVDCSNSTQ